MTARLESGKVEVTLSALLKNILTDASEVQFNMDNKVTLNLQHGTVLNQANRGNQSKSRILSAASSEVLDLYDLAALDVGGGPGKDVLGLSVANVELIGLLAYNVGDAGNDGSLIIGGEGTGAAWADFIQSDTATLRIPPTGFMLIGCGKDPAWLINDVSNHLLKFAASGGAVKYNVAWLTRDA